MAELIGPTFRDIAPTRYPDIAKYTGYVDSQEEPGYMRHERVRYASELLAAYLSHPGAQLISDVDGVIYRPNSFTKASPTSDLILPAMAALSERVPIGVATARGTKVIRQLENDGVPIRGDSILEEGQYLMDRNGKREYIVNPGYVAFAADVNRNNRVHASMVDSFEKMVEYDESGELVFWNGLGGHWEGDCRISPMFSTSARNKDGRVYTNDEVVKEIRRIYEPIRQLHGQTEGVHYDYYVGRLGGENPIGHVRMLGRTSDGRRISKADGLRRLVIRANYVADGYRDTEAGVQVFNSGGCVVSIEGNEDLTNEPETFHDIASIVLRDPEEWAETVLYTRMLLDEIKNPQPVTVYDLLTQ